MRAAGAVHGQEMSPDLMQGLIRSAGRHPRERTTLYAMSTRNMCGTAVIADNDPESRRILGPGVRREDDSAAVF